MVANNMMNTYMLPMIRPLNKVNLNTVPLIDGVGRS